ncbi:WxL domain-containing protein [Weissella confusa]|uniref:WxL domain-containing protein n=1 Tax=Weissella fermenti TaxID=2987699 RepID=A0ABT6D988_9LACO|nr:MULTISPECIES: WxL domain-containing protein [Weissella]MBJ7688154.1 WxL domain-containing protein [Weissella confusa]MCW0926190.1 WxL domain-containing protein [Weissella sp. LMG 11983]MDF9300257.1 WxL domain-containing protein [Weissella sp. BK2]
MKKTVFLTTTAVLASLMASSVALAAQYPAKQGDPDASTAQTKATVTFVAPKENPDKPVAPGTDPDNPNPVTPNQPDNPGNTSKADLKLVWAPDLDFGSKNEIKSMTQVLDAKKIPMSDTNYGPAYVQVSDEGGKAEGWNVTVKQDDEFKTSDNDVLTGAFLTFANPAVSMSTTKGGNAKFDGVKGYGITKLLTTGDSLVMDAAKGTMPGNYFATFNGKDDSTMKDDVPTYDGVKLTVPGGSALAKQYNTTLTWTLNNVPATQTPATPAAK